MTRTTDTSTADHSPARFSRRQVLAGMAGGTAALAFGSFGAPSAAFAATPGSNPGKYKLDLGGYMGPELSSDTIQLRFMRQDFPPNVNAVIQAAYDNFSKAYPNITVQEERVPYGDLPKKVQVYVASGTAPDIMMGRNDFVAAYAAGQLALPLQQYLTADYINDVFPPLRISATIDNNFLCLPWETNPTFLYFNRDIFDKYKVATPPEVSDIEKGWSVDQFLATLEEITTKARAAGDTTTYALSASTYGNGGPGSNYTQLESLWVRMMGDPNADKSTTLYKTFAGVSDDGLTATGYLDTPEAIAGMTHYQTLFSKGLTPKGAVPDQYTGGVAAMSFGSMNFADRFRTAGETFKWGTTPAPKGKIAYSTTVADSPFVWSGTPHPAEAAALLAFICNDENRNNFHREWGSMPARQSQIAAIPLYQTDQTNKLAAATAGGAYGPPKSVGWFDYFNAINPAVKDIALGADPAARLHEAATQIDGLLAKYK